MAPPTNRTGRLRGALHDVLLARVGGHRPARRDGVGRRRRRRRRSRRRHGEQERRPEHYVQQALDARAHAATRTTQAPSHTCVFRPFFLLERRHQFLFAWISQKCAVLWAIVVARRRRRTKSHPARRTSVDGTTIEDVAACATLRQGRRRRRFGHAPRAPLHRVPALRVDDAPSLLMEQRHRGRGDLCDFCATSVYAVAIDALLLPATTVDDLCRERSAPCVVRVTVVPPRSHSAR